MDTLQQLFDSFIDNKTNQVQRDLLRKKFSELGVNLRDEQITEFLENSSEGTIDVELDDSQLVGSKIDLKDYLEGKICVEFSDAELEEVINSFSPVLSDAIPAIVEECADQFLKELRKTLRPHVKLLVRERKQLEKKRERFWRKPFDLLELFVATARQTGSDFNAHYRETAVKENDLVFDVLARLHARSCQVGSEVLVLLKSGFPDGAHARWRTLHEIAVISMFIAKHGNEVAERYLVHEIVQSYKGALQYQTHCHALRYEPFSDETFQQIKTAYDDALNRYGSTFKGDYGWASSVLGNQKPTFSDIEKDIDLEKWRPFYRMASRPVHANAAGVTVQLGLPPGIDQMLLAGASDTGFTDPAHGTAISLVLITTTLLRSKPSIDTLMLCSVLMNLQREIGDEFLKTQILYKEKFASKKFELADQNSDESE